MYNAALNGELLDTLRSWADMNAGETIRPTGNPRNLNPLITSVEGTKTVAPAWWGYLVAGAPSKFPSINTRNERLAEKPEKSAQRAIVPATHWFERAADRQWYAFGEGRKLLGMAAIARPGRLATGEEYTCYSLVMRPAADHIASIHDRMLLLVAADLSDEWLDDTQPLTTQLVEAAVAASGAERARIRSEELPVSPLGPAETPLCSALVGPELGVQEAHFTHLILFLTLPISQ